MRNKYVPSTSHTLFIIPINNITKYYNSYFTDDTIEAQKVKWFLQDHVVSSRDSLWNQDLCLLLTIPLLPHPTFSPKSSKTSPQVCVSRQETVCLNIFTDYHLHTLHYIRPKELWRILGLDLFLDLGQICLFVSSSLISQWSIHRTRNKNQKFLSKA